MEHSSPNTSQSQLRRLSLLLVRYLCDMRRLVVLLVVVVVVDAGLVEHSVGPLVVGTPAQREVLFVLLVLGLVVCLVLRVRSRRADVVDLGAHEGSEPLLELPA